MLLKKRLGFVRAAVAASMPLVPIYCFGNTAAVPVCALLPKSLAAAGLEREGAARALRGGTHRAVRPTQGAHGVGLGGHAAA